MQQESRQRQQGDDECRRVAAANQRQEKEIQDESTTLTFASTTTYTTSTASLLQVAAAHVLHDHDDPDSDNDDTNRCSSTRTITAPIDPPSSPLRSLRTRTLPALPDEQDRRRFIGCLAAVLAAAYDYDEGDKGGDDRNSYYNDEQQHDDNNSTSTFMRNDSNSHGWGDDEEEEEDEPVDFEIRTTREFRHEMSSTHTSIASSSSHSVSRSQREGRSFAAPARPTTATSTSSSSANPSQSRSFRPRKTAERLATLRHRKRRYTVLSNLLLSSAELMLLEKSQAKAFLPILSRFAPTRQQPQQPRTTRASSNSSSPAKNTKRQQQLPSVYSATVHSFSDYKISNHRSSSSLFWREQIQRMEHLEAFIEHFSPGAAFRCLAMLLLQHLLHSDQGYDARIRHSLKVLGVLLLIQEQEKEVNDDEENAGGGDDDDVVARATRRFESLERCIAQTLLELPRQQQLRQSSNHPPRAPRKQQRQPSGNPEHSSHQLVVRCNTSNHSTNNQSLPSSSLVSIMPTRSQWMRGFKIGGTAVVAGTLFAVTGGLAAPGIAAGLAAVAGGTAAATATAAVLSSAAVITTIFGVGGGGLAAYKMQRRTQGLTEFKIRIEKSKDVQKDRNSMNQNRTDPRHHEVVEAELFSTICISGWLRDQQDFQRPWGVTPDSPPITDRLELLERFYSIHRPDHVPNCRQILRRWEGEEKELWDILRQKYGRDPDHLFPLDDGPRFQSSLTLDQEETVELLFTELGHLPGRKEGDVKKQHTPFERMRQNWERARNQDRQTDDVSSEGIRLGSTNEYDSMHGPTSIISAPSTNSSFDADSSFSEPNETSGSSYNGNKDFIYAPPKHLATVWDFHAHFGGELYTVKWESELLEDLCDSVADLAKDLVGSGAAQILKHTALSTLMSAIAWPYALVNAANMIDGTWTLAVERADEAGKELARCLLFSRAGHRPITLVGYSFGARAIYSCLKELARYQAKWEEFHETGKFPSNVMAWDDTTSKKEFFENMREPASIVEDAIICGLPNHMSHSSWQACREVVAGRLVNCFSQRDLILSLMFQFKRLGLKPVCGTCPVNVAGVENIDVSDIIPGHQEYCCNMRHILQHVRFGQPFQGRPSRLVIPTVIPLRTETKPPGDFSGEDKLH